MVTFACAVVAYLRSLFLPRHKLALEAVALRQQLAVFQRKQPRPKLDRLDRLFWIVLRRLWEGCCRGNLSLRCVTCVLAKLDIYTYRRYSWCDDDLTREMVSRTTVNTTVARTM